MALLGLAFHSSMGRGLQKSVISAAALDTAAIPAKPTAIGLDRERAGAAPNATPMIDACWSAVDIKGP
jgi:hypothetical protein